MLKMLVEISGQLLLATRTHETHDYESRCNLKLVELREQFDEGFNENSNFYDYIKVVLRYVDRFLLTTSSLKP